MSEMVHHVASALFAGDDCGEWTDDPGPHSGDCTDECHSCRRCLYYEYIAKARRAIAAMREPTLSAIVRGDEAIIKVLTDHPSDPQMTNGTPAENCWRAMIDGALGQEIDPPPDGAEYCGACDQMFASAREYDGHECMPPEERASLHEAEGRTSPSTGSTQL